MTLLFKILNIACTMKRCAIDADCYFKTRPDVHTLFCVENQCQKILPPGKHCKRPTDCSSYGYFGPLACTSKCKPENECEVTEFGFRDTTYCCKAIPESNTCNPNRPLLLSGCDAKQTCSPTKDGTYECLSNKSSSWIIGMLMSIFGNIAINLGINFQKKSYRFPYIEILDYELQVFYLGCLIYILGKLFAYLAYLYGNQSLIAALSATGLVSNSIFAPLINDEVFTWNDLCAIVFTFSGTTLVIVNGVKSSKVYSLCELLRMFRNTGTVLWFIFIALSIILLFLLIKFVEVNSDWELPGDNFRFMKIDDLYFEEQGYIMKYFMILGYVGLSSFIASFTTLSIKSLGEMVDKTLAGDNQFTFMLTYMFIISLVMCTFLQIYWLNRALRHYDALLVIPLFHVSWTILSICTAGIYFQEFEHYSSYQFRNFIVGLLIIFIGSFFLGLRIINKNTIDANEIDLVSEKISKHD